MTKLRFANAIMALAAGLVSVSSLAADPSNLEDEFPLTISDAKTAHDGEINFQLTTTFEQDGGEKQIRVNPNVVYGLLPDLQIELRVPAIYESEDRRGSGDLQFRGQYRLPSYFEGFETAVAGQLAAPTGIESEGVDTEFSLIVTRPLLIGNYRPTLHVQGSWGHNASPRAHERFDTYRFGVGYQVDYNENLAVVLGAVREVEKETDAESNLIELGSNYSVGANGLFGAAIGAGIGDDSPDFLVRLGYSYSL